MKRVVSLITILGLVVCNGAFGAGCTKCKKCSSGKCNVTKNQVYHVEQPAPSANNDVATVFMTEPTPYARSSSYNYVGDYNNAERMQTIRNTSDMQRNAYYRNTVTREYRTNEMRDSSRVGMYVGGRLDINFLTWKNDYEFVDTIGAYGVIDFENKFSFKPVLGGDVVLGVNFTDKWRGDLEIGYMGGFSDKDDWFKFSLSTWYATLNAYYTFYEDFYLGGGLGMAWVATDLDAYVSDTSWPIANAVFLSGDRQRTRTSPMGAIMLGHTWNLGNDWVIDLRYRLAAFSGTTQTRGVEYDNADDSTHHGGPLTNKIGIILDNSISVGVRYEF